MYLNSVQIIGFIGKDPERREARGSGAALRLPFSWSQHSGHRRTLTTSGPQKLDGIAWSPGTVWASALRHRSARAITFWSKARSSAAPTSAKSARARRRGREANGLADPRRLDSEAQSRREGARGTAFRLRRSNRIARRGGARRAVLKRDTSQGPRPPAEALCTVRSGGRGLGAIRSF